MKKICFYFALIISILLVINIADIIISDFNRLTEYGYGFLTGKVILLMLFCILAFLTRKHNNTSQNTF